LTDDDWTASDDEYGTNTSISWHFLTGMGRTKLGKNKTLPEMIAQMRILIPKNRGRRPVTVCSV
jgi:hypothetical protein